MTKKTTKIIANGWEADDDENKLKFFRLPNYSLKKFQEITGIDATDDYKRLVNE